jgi:cobalt-zinc-cadmium efflux system outer membrane protein
MLRPCSRLLPLLLLPCLPGPLSGQERYSLDDLLEMGRERSPLVLALKAELAAQDADRRDQGRFENPQLAYEWGTGEPLDGGPDRSLGGFSLEQRVENPITRHFRLGGLQARVEAAAEGVREGTLEVEYEIKLHFFRILYLMERETLAALNEEALSEIRSLIETRAEVGEVRELEAIRLRVEHLRARNELEAARLELDQYRSHLNTFLGNALPEGFQLAGTLEAEPSDPDLAYLTREALPGHPVLRRAAREKEAAANALRRSRVSWLPDPVLTASSVRELDGDVRRLGFGVSLPLWNQSRAATQRDRETVLMAEYREEALRLELEAQLMIHHNHLRLSRQTLSLFEEGLLAEAEASMEIAETSYRAGEISFMEYLDARRTYHSIQIQRQQALYDWNVENAALVRAAGGGI